MATITEDYCSKEIYRLLIENHFACPCECPAYKDGYKNGMKDMKQQMMKNTVDAVCYVTHYEDETQVAYSVSYPKGEETDKYHDKVKLIIIKED